MHDPKKQTCLSSLHQAVEVAAVTSTRKAVHETVGVTLRLSFLRVVHLMVFLLRPSAHGGALLTCQ